MKTLSMRSVTDILHLKMSTEMTFPVGDGVAPNDGGWAGGTPNTGQFTPYAVLKCTGATDANGRSVGSPWSAWDVTFSIGTFGGLRSQCDWVADSVRGWIVAELAGRGIDVVDVDGTLWRLGGARSGTVGGPFRTDEMDPPYWQSTDTYQFTYDLVRSP